MLSVKVRYGLGGILHIPGEHQIDQGRRPHEIIDNQPTYNPDVVELICRFHPTISRYYLDGQFNVSRIPTQIKVLIVRLSEAHLLTCIPLLGQLRKIEFDFSKSSEPIHQSVLDQFMIAAGKSKSLKYVEFYGRIRGGKLFVPRNDLIVIAAQQHDVAWKFRKRFRCMTLFLWCMDGLNVDLLNMLCLFLTV